MCRTKKSGVISRFGGKSQLLDNLNPIFEQCQYDYDIQTFIDACAGSGKITLNLDKTLFKKVIFNEIDRGICELFNCLKDKKKTAQIIYRLDRMNYSRSVFNGAVKKLKEDKTENKLNSVEMAINTYIVAQQSYSSNMQSYNEINQFNKKYVDKVFALDEFYDILRDIEISNRDCRDVLKEYENCNSALIYVDPPYIPITMSSSKTYGEFSFTTEEHENLVDILLKSKAKIVLSGYDNSIYDRLVQNGWEKIFLKTVHVSSSTVGKKEREFIWLNFRVHSSIIADISEDEFY